MTAAEALSCQSCGLAVTPCLVCASPVPVPQGDDLLIKTCSGCGVVNLLGDKYREVLDIPSSSALSSPMIRRAQIARVGRRPYILAKHAHFMHLSKKKSDDDEDGGSGSPGVAIREMSERLVPRTSPVPEIFASAEEGHPLTFLPYMQDTKGARLHEKSACVGRKAVDARHFYPFSDSESPVKLMRPMISPSVHRETDNVEKNLSGRMNSALHQAQESLNNGNSVAAASDGITPNMCTDVGHDIANLGEATGKSAAGSGLSADPHVQSIHGTPFIPRCNNNRELIIGDADVGEGEKILNPLDRPLENLHKTVEGEVNQTETCRMEPSLPLIPSSIHRLDSFKEVFKTRLVDRALPNREDAHRHEGGEAPISTTGGSTGSVRQPHKYFEHDFYLQVNTEEPVKLPSTSTQKVDTEGEGEDHDHISDSTGLEEVPTHRHERVCSVCGQTVGGPRRSSLKVDEAEFMRCCTQILELHCPHALRAETRTPCAYPVCYPVPRFPLPAGAISSSKSCQTHATQFTVEVLRIAHSTLTSSTQESTSEEVTSPFCGVDQALSMAERFMDIKDRMAYVQGRMQKIDAASTQVTRDLRAYADRGAFPLASRLIPRLLSQQMKDHADRAKDDVQAMTAFLLDINKILTTCFQYVAKILEMSLSSIGENDRASNAVNLSFFMLEFDNKPALEAVRTAVPLWLRLYHDVAHSSGLLK